MYGSRFDFAKLKRWPGDGLEKHARRLREENETIYEIPNPSPRQRQITLLLGGWHSPIRLEDLPPQGRDLFTSLPFIIQQKAAEEFQNFEAAIDHLFEVCDNDDVKTFLKRIDAFGAVKYGKVSLAHFFYLKQRKICDFKPSALFSTSQRSFLAFDNWSGGETGEKTDDEYRMRVDDDGMATIGRRTYFGVDLILGKLMVAGEANDYNIRLLFGHENHVMGRMMFIADLFSTDSPVGSPAYYKQQELFDERKLKAVRVCGNCNSVEADSKLLSCAACHREMYCSASCQKAHWVLHKPGCRRAQGKSVKPEDAAASAAKQKESDDVKQLQRDLKKMAMDASEAALIEADRDRIEFPSQKLWDCNGKPIRSDFHWCFPQLVMQLAPTVGLTFVSEMLFIILPLGVKDEQQRGIFLRNPENNDGSILIMFTKLFLDRGNGSNTGTSVDDIYVISGPSSLVNNNTKTKTKTSPQQLPLDQRRSHPDEVTWVPVARPSTKSDGITNAWTWLQLWLRQAKVLATTPSNDPFYKKGSVKRAKRQMGYDGP